MSTDKQVSLQSLIPPKVLIKLIGKKVVETSFGAGPACCAGKVDSHEPPTTFEQGMSWLERYRGVMSRGCAIFEDGSQLWFHWGQFDRYVVGSLTNRPRPGVSIADMTSKRMLTSCGLRREEKFMVTDDEEAVVVGEYSDEEVARMDKREERARKQKRIK